MKNAERKRQTAAIEPDPERKGLGSPKQEDRDPCFAELDALIAEERAAELKVRRPAKKLQHKRRSPGLPREYRQEIIHMAAEHREKFKVRFAKDPGLRDRGARLYRTLVFPRPRGNKPAKRVRMAVKLIQELGHRPTPLDWIRINLLCIRGLAKMSARKRRYQCGKLQHTVTTYMRRHNIPPYCVTGTLIA